MSEQAQAPKAAGHPLTSHVPSAAAMKAAIRLKLARDITR
jgi:hypothetical protein